MSNRFKKFISYYKPYKGLFFLDMFFALTAAGISLIYPLIVRYVTNVLLVNYDINQVMHTIIKLGFLMIGLAVLEFICNFYITYQGHVMGAKMEYDMRNDIFEHYQKLSFNFYDNQKTGQLMSRITNDLFDITELCHHGPEDLVISIIKFVGTFIILINVNLPLTLIVFIFIPIMFTFAMHMKNKMNRAFKANRERIAEINAQIEDNLSGIRVVKSFANEKKEMDKFHEGNRKFVASKRDSYWQMANFHSGLGFFISLINVAVVLGGAALLTKEIIELSDLLTFLLYINNII